MSSTATVTIHSSQFPEAVRRDLLESLRIRRVNHKFHYDSIKQTQKWLALHQLYSPTRNDPDCQAIYEQSFAAAAARIEAPAVHVMGLGCGGGQKDTRLLKLLKSAGKKIFYTPCDVSTAMVLTARQTALALVPEGNCFPVVCDLVSATELPIASVSRFTHHVSRIITFFGMIPNFEPRTILPKLASFIGPKDVLLFSANLAPGRDYAAGMQKILPQYDNPPTRDWLMTFLTGLGVEDRDGELKFTIETGQSGLKRIVVRFHFRRARRIDIEDKSFQFKKGEALQLFFSYRYTPERVRKVLGARDFQIGEQWLASSGEEGVFLCHRA